jgi:hypothetical protein
MNYQFGRRPSASYYMLIIAIILLIAALMNLVLSRNGMGGAFGVIMLAVYMTGAVFSLYLYLHLRRLPVAELYRDRIMFYAIPPKKPEVIYFEDIVKLEKSNIRYLVIHYHVGEKVFRRRLSYFSLAHPDASILALERNYNDFTKKQKDEKSETAEDTAD